MDGMQQNHSRNPFVNQVFVVGGGYWEYRIAGGSRNPFVNQVFVVPQRGNERI